MFNCQFCGKNLTTAAGVKRHQALAPECRAKLEIHLQSYAINAYDKLFGPQDDHDKDDVLAENHDAHHWEMEDVTAAAIQQQPRVVYDTPGPTPIDRRASVEDVEDDGDDDVKLGRFIESFPEVFRAGAPIGKEKVKTDFEKMRDERRDAGEGADAQEWSPFKDHDEWGLTQWLMKNVGQTKIDEFLKLPVVSLTYRNIIGE